MFFSNSCVWWHYISEFWAGSHLHFTSKISGREIFSKHFNGMLPQWITTSLPTFPTTGVVKVFLLSCRKRNVITKSLWFIVANRNLKNSSAYRACQRNLLGEEVSKNRPRTRPLSAQASTAYSILSTLVSCVDLIHLKSVSDNRRIGKDRKASKDPREETSSIICRHSCWHS